MNRLFSGRSDMPFALLLLAPSLLLLGGLVAWPMVSNIEISFLRLPLNPNIESTFVGVSNYVRILSDPGFWHSLWMTVWYTTLVVAGSTVLGLAVAMFFNREFRLRKTARSLVLLSYVTPSISLVFAWKYMFNNGYGIVNYLGVDLLHLYEQAPLWFDNPGSSFVLVVLFAIWRYFPYAFISFVVPAAWGMFTFRLPPMTSPRSLDGDRKMVSDSLRVLEQAAARTGTVVYLEPLNRYQDHMINTLADARRYIVENNLKHVQIIGDFYHMNIEEDNLAQALHDNRDLLGHVHIADNHRYQPGSGTLDFHALFEQLRADNYQGYVVYEGRIRAEDPAQAYRDSLAWVRTC